MSDPKSARDYERITHNYRSKYSTGAFTHRLLQQLSLPKPEISGKAALEHNHLEHKLDKIFHNDSSGNAFLEKSKLPVPKNYLLPSKSSNFRVVGKRTGSSSKERLVRGRNLKVFHSAITTDTLGFFKRPEDSKWVTSEQIRNDQMVKKKVLTNSFRASLITNQKRDPNRSSSSGVNLNSFSKSSSSANLGNKSATQSRLLSSQLHVAPETHRGSVTSR